MKAWRHRQILMNVFPKILKYYFIDHWSATVMKLKMWTNHIFLYRFISKSCRYKKRFVWKFAVKIRSWKSRRRRLIMAELGVLIKSFSTVNRSGAWATITKQQTIFERLCSYLSDNIFLKSIFRLKLSEFLARFHEEKKSSYCRHSGVNVNVWVGYVFG